MYISGEVKYFTNGFLIIREDKTHVSKNLNYRGIEGDVWPLYIDISNVEKNELQTLIDYVDDNITTFSDYSVADVTNDINFINRYINACNRVGLNITVLLCETEKNSPHVEISLKSLNEDFLFIGYDYGYCGSDYYSCVNSDIGRFSEMNSLTLNKYGLFDTESEIIKFINLRTYLKNTHLEKCFEQRPDECYTIYKLWRYKGQYPIRMKV